VLVEKVTINPTHHLYIFSVYGFTTKQWNLYKTKHWSST